MKRLQNETTDESYERRADRVERLDAIRRASHAVSTRRTAQNHKVSESARRVEQALLSRVGEHRADHPLEGSD
jgi:ribosomal protein L34E